MAELRRWGRYGSIVITAEAWDFEDIASRIDSGAVEQAVRSGAMGAAIQARNLAPIKTGKLRSGIILNPVRERTNRPMVYTYDIGMDRKMNEYFVKYNRRPFTKYSRRHKKIITLKPGEKRYYYPASQEYGWTMPNGKRIAGKYFMRNAGLMYESKFRQAVEKAVLEALEGEGA